MTDKKAAAIAELREKTLAQIQVDTAITWAYRAWAARQLSFVGYRDNDGSGPGFEHDAVEYEHEAIEHAALCGVDEALPAVRAIINEK